MFSDQGEGCHGLDHPQRLALLRYCRGCWSQTFCFPISVSSSSTFMCFWNTARVPISEAQSRSQMLERHKGITVQRAERTQNINWDPHVIAERWWQQEGRRRGKYGQLWPKSSVFERTEFLELVSEETLGKLGRGRCRRMRWKEHNGSFGVHVCYDLINDPGILKDWNCSKERIPTSELQRAFVFCGWNYVPSKDKLLSDIQSLRYFLGNRLQWLLLL